MELTNAVFLKARSGHEQEVLSIMLELVPQTRKEAGCLAYQLHQSISNPNDLFIYEHWKSKEAFDFHMRTSYVKDLLSRHDELIDGTIEILPFRNL
jgi:quinol monooxygenase YgiN